MPKINVYVSDRLAEATRRYDISLSAVCQDALEREVRSRLPLLELTPRSRDVLHAAAREAAQLGHSYIGTEHLLLGLLAEPDGIAAQVLQQLQVADAIRQRIGALAASEGYRRGTNRIVDRDGNFRGYLVEGPDGALKVVADEGGTEEDKSPGSN